MMPTRRWLLRSAAAFPLLAPFAGRAADDPRMTERAYGRANAAVTVDEYFSLTCPHCAAFSRDTMPRVRTELIAPGKLRIVFRDYPLDQLALTAAAVARALPVDRYEPFVTTLLGSQDRWAYARDINPQEELWKLAAAAGMGRQLFDLTVADDGLKSFILGVQDEGEKKWGVHSTPTFIIKGRAHAGALSFETFSGLVTAA